MQASGPAGGSSDARSWELWVDTGGTFTDCVGRDPEGRLHRVKVLSSACVRGRVVEQPARNSVRVRLPWSLPDGFFRDCQFRSLGGDALAVEFFDGARSLLRLAGSPGRLPPASGFEILSPEEAPLLAARILTRTRFGDPLPPLSMRLATTRGTNALLERQGAATALFVTRGFADLLLIGNQQRPDLFSLSVEKSAPLYTESVEVDERLAADGSVLRPLSLDGIGAEAARLLDAGVETAAVALLHSYRNPAHELRLAEALLAAGFRHVSRSEDLAGRIQYLPRAETAVLNAYLAPAVGDYLERVAGGLGGARLLTMTSAGGVVRAESFHPKDSLLSGPAGGVVGAAAVARASGVERLIAFDMGGTSTDVSRFDGEFDYRYETRIGSVRLLAPTLAIETVAAGGGSVCSFDGLRFKVGPESARAWPGPACYGAGGPLTLTDANLLLGRLDPERFEIPIDSRAAAAAAARLLEELEDSGESVELEPALEGLLRIADERMADAIRRISVREGFDPKELTLVAFGGAGGQHACAVAELLEIGRILVPADAGLLSAHGLGRARIERFAERQILQPLESVGGRVPAWLEELSVEARDRVEAEGVDRGGIEVRFRRAHLRLAGQDATLEIDVRPDAELEEDFKTAYRDRFGYRPPSRPIEVESLRVVASSRHVTAEAAAGPASVAEEAQPAGSRRSWTAGGWREVALYERSRLRAGHELSGPALVFERHSATWVADGWRARVDGQQGLLLARGRE